MYYYYFFTYILAEVRHVYITWQKESCFYSKKEKEKKKELCFRERERCEGRDCFDISQEIKNKERKIHIYHLNINKILQKSEH